MGNLVSKLAAAHAGEGRPPRRAALAGDLQLNNPAAAQAGAEGGLVNNQAGGDRRDLHRSAKYGAAAITAAVMSFLGIWSVLKTRGYTPDLVPAILLAMGNFSVGAWVSTEGREHQTLASVNFYASFVPLVMALAHGAEFNPELARKIYDSIDTLLSLLSG